MIDFACKKFDLDEVIRCGLGITKAEYRIFKIFISKRSYSLEAPEIVNVLGLDLSTVQRGVKKLHELGVLSRSQRNLEGGGYIFNYKIKGKSEIKQRVLAMINGWSRRVESELDDW